MKSKESYLQQLKYYKGEEESPFDDNNKICHWGIKPFYLIDTRKVA